MTTRKALIAKLDAMNTSDVLVRYGDYRNTHPMSATPLQKALAQALGVKAIEARTYTTVRGVTHSSPAWLVELYRKLVTIVYAGNDVNVRTMLAVIR